MTQKFLSLLGLCMRAGRMVTGEDAGLQAIRSGKAQLIIIDGAASENALKMMRDSCSHYGVELVITGKDELGPAIGKNNRKVAVITDKGFAQGLLKAVE